MHLEVEELASPSVRDVSVPITVPVKRNRFGRLYDVPMFSGFLWSEWQDLNLRPPRPERGALPDCATLRLEVRSYIGGRHSLQARPSPTLPAQAVRRYERLQAGEGVRGASERGEVENASRFCHMR